MRIGSFLSKVCLSVVCGAVFGGFAFAKSQPDTAQNSQINQKSIEDMAQQVAKNSKKAAKKASKEAAKKDSSKASKKDSDKSTKSAKNDKNAKNTENAQSPKSIENAESTNSANLTATNLTSTNPASTQNTSATHSHPIGANNRLSKQAFFEAVEKNTISLVQNKAQFDSLIEAQKAVNSWDSPYAEIETGFAKNAIGRNELEVTALFMLKPKLPWVQTLLHKSLKLQTEQYQKSYELYKNLAFISAKRLYLTYELTKEKYNVAIAREHNFLSQLQIAKAKLDAGSMSKKDYISFNNSYLDAKLLKMQTQTQLLDLQRMLHQILGFVDVHKQINQDDIDSEILSVAHDVVVDGIAFGYADVAPDFARESLESSPYISILDLQAKNYQTNAKLANRDRFDTLELGGGLMHAESSDGAQLRFSIPLPVTPKNTHLKRKWLALHSGTLREGEITKSNLLVSMDSYLDQLHSKKSFIELQQENIQNKKDLVEMGKIAYEAQKISLFEYLAYQNSYMDSLITLADAKLEYVGIQSLLEETLGSMIGDK